MRAKSPCDGLLPLSIGGVTLSEGAPGAMTCLMPYKGRAGALSGALEAACGIAAPAPGRSTVSDGARILWFGRETLLLIGPEPAPELAQYAAVADHSDAWAVVRLEGPGAVDVLARLVPVDLRESAFAPGATARSELRHMQAAITRLSGDAFEIMVFRSMARALVHDLRDVMESVAARAGR
nr:sarcosine oxidase subunit gamma [Roseovarius sp. PS-C2]